MNLQGIFAAITTPFAGDGSVAHDKLRENVRRYNRTGLRGYLAIGSTGESVLLGFDEIERIWAAVREAAGPEKILIAGTGVDGTAATIVRTRRAAAHGFHAALVKTPYFFKQQMTTAALEEHYRQVADVSPIPVLIYSVPQLTGISVTADLVARLSEHPNIVGIKDSSGNVPLAAEIVRSSSPEFQMLSGPAEKLLASLSAGAAGGIQAFSCFLPEPAIAIYEAFRAGNKTRAGAFQDSIAEASQKIVNELGVPGVKHAMDVCGYFGGEARRPLLPLTEAQRKTVDATLLETVASTAKLKNDAVQADSRPL